MEFVREEERCREEVSERVLLHCREEVLPSVRLLPVKVFPQPKSWEISLNTVMTMPITMAKMMMNGMMNNPNRLIMTFFSLLIHF